MSHKFTVGEYTTRDGRRATVVADRGEGHQYPLFGWIANGPVVSWEREGAYSCIENGGDLMPPAPEMIRVPLSADDIPQGAEFREVGGDLRMSLSGVELAGVYMHRIGYMDFESLFYRCEMRAPGGEWRGCWKEVQP